MTRLSDEDAKLDDAVVAIEAKLAQEANAKLVERSRIQEAEASRVRLESELAQVCTYPPSQGWG